MLGPHLLQLPWSIFSDLSGMLNLFQAVANVHLCNYLLDLMYFACCQFWQSLAVFRLSCVWGCHAAEHFCEDVLAKQSLDVQRQPILMNSGRRMNMRMQREGRSVIAI